MEIYTDRFTQYFISKFKSIGFIVYGDCVRTRYEYIYICVQKYRHKDLVIRKYFYTLRERGPVTLTATTPHNLKYSPSNFYQPPLEIHSFLIYNLQYRTVKAVLLLCHCTVQNIAHTGVKLHFCRAL